METTTTCADCGDPCSPSYDQCLSCEALDRDERLRASVTLHQAQPGVDPLDSMATDR